MHIKPYDNKNEPIVGIKDPITPLVYFNIIKLKAGETFSSQVPGYETCLVPATGSIDVHIGPWSANDIGGVVPTCGTASPMLCMFRRARKPF